MNQIDTLKIKDICRTLLLDIKTIKTIKSIYRIPVYN